MTEVIATVELRKSDGALLRTEEIRIPTGSTKIEDIDLIAKLFIRNANLSDPRQELWYSGEHTFRPVEAKA